MLKFGSSSQQRQKWLELLEKGKRPSGWDYRSYFVDTVQVVTLSGPSLFDPLLRQAKIGSEQLEVHTPGCVVRREEIG
jgi:hypothetical protein